MSWRVRSQKKVYQQDMYKKGSGGIHMVQRLHMLAIITARRIYSYVLYFNLWAHFEHSTTLQNTQAPMQRTLMLIFERLYV